MAWAELLVTVHRILCTVTTVTTCYLVLVEIFAHFQIL